MGRGAEEGTWQCGPAEHLQRCGHMGVGAAAAGPAVAIISFGGGPMRRRRGRASAPGLGLPAVSPRARSPGWPPIAARPPSLMRRIVGAPSPTGYTAGETPVPHSSEATMPPPWGRPWPAALVCLRARAPPVLCAFTIVLFSVDSPSRSRESSLVAASACVRQERARIPWRIFLALRRRTCP